MYDFKMNKEDDEGCLSFSKVIWSHNTIKNVSSNYTIFIKKMSMLIWKAKSDQLILYFTVICFIFSLRFSYNIILLLLYLFIDTNIDDVINSIIRY